MRQWLTCFWLVLGIFFANGASASQFIPLGDAPGGAFSSTAYAISPDGEWVVGSSHGYVLEPGHPLYYDLPAHRAFVWHADTFAILPGGTTSSGARATGVSNGGTVIVGYDSFASGTRALMWNSELEGVPFPPKEDLLGDEPPPTTRGDIWRNVTSDGAHALGAVVLDSRTGQNRAVPAIVDTDTLLPHVPDPADTPEIDCDEPAQSGSCFFVPVDLSDDARVILGSYFRSPRLWERDTARVIPVVDDAYEDDYRPRAVALSGDGRIVVGSIEDPQDVRHAAWWSESAELVSLQAESYAYDVSFDGTVVVGSLLGETGWEAFAWTQADGVLVLAGLLGDSLPDDWVLREARGVSAAGDRIVGWGTNPNGDREAFLAIIPQPEAAALAVAALAPLPLIQRRAGARKHGRSPGLVSAPISAVPRSRPWSVRA